MRRGYLWVAVTFIFMFCMVFTEVDAARAEYTPTLDTNIKVYTPSAGATLTAGSSYDITWDALGPVQSINIMYSPDGGISWSSQEILDGNPGSYTWTVPSTPTNQGIIRIDITGIMFKGYPPSSSYHPCL